MKNGFTLLEILIVIAILAMLAYLIVPMSIGFYKTQQLDSTTDGLIQALRMARSKTIAGELESDFSVHIEQEQYTIFKGNDWENRDNSYDINFGVDQSINFSGLNQVTFERLGGNPSEVGIIILDNGQNTRIININVVGMISSSSS